MTRKLSFPTHLTQQAIIESLAQKVRQCQAVSRGSQAATISTGYAMLDRALLAGGLHRGTIVEWLMSEEGSGATRLALAAAREACGEGGALVVVDRRRTFYPLAAAACGIDLSNMILVRPASDRDETWAIDQSLRAGGASAVLAWPEKLDDHLFRRLQLAAEAGGAIGLLVRPAQAIAEPSWSEVRWLVEPLASLPSREGIASRRVRLSLLRSPGRPIHYAQGMILDLENGSGEEFESQAGPRIRRNKRIA